MDQINSPGRFNILPVVVKNILIINGLFFLATFVLGNSYGIDLKDILGLHYLPSEKFRPYQFITYMFMHNDLMHLFFNMFAVWMFGAAIENFWGSKRFLTYYLITGLGAALVHYTIVYFEFQPMLNAIRDAVNDPGYASLQNLMSSPVFDLMTEPGQNMINAYASGFRAGDVSPAESARLVQQLINFREELLNAPVVIGASGSLFGILLAFGMMFPNSMIYLYFTIPVKAKYFVVLYGVLELIYGVSNVAGFSSSNIAHFAHLGGMLFGFFIIMLWRKKRIS